MRTYIHTYTLSCLYVFVYAPKYTVLKLTHLSEWYEHCLPPGGAHFEHLHYAYHGNSTH
jgi:hypothetical protein